MSVREIVARHLASDYGGASLSEYRESGDEVRFQVPAPLRDPQAAAFRSGADVLNELAISHRLSLSIGRRRYGLSDDSVVAMTSIESLVRSMNFAHECEVSLRFQAVTNRRDTLTAFRSTLVTEHGTESRTTTASFNVLPPSLAKFLRRERQFSDVDDVEIMADEAGLSTVGEDQFRYQPSDGDRHSDGRRVEHVPALTLIDLALLVYGQASPGAACRNVSAEFLNYTDPRRAFEIALKKDAGAVEFAQNGRSVATVTVATAPDR